MRCDCEHLIERALFERKYGLPHDMNQQVLVLLYANYMWVYGGLSFSRMTRFRNESFKERVTSMCNFPLNVLL